MSSLLTFTSLIAITEDVHFIGIAMSSTRIRHSYSQFGKKRLVKSKGRPIDKRERFKIIVDGKDYTPKPLVEGEDIPFSDDLTPPVEAIFAGLSSSGLSSVFLGGGGLRSKIQASMAGGAGSIDVTQMVEVSLSEPSEIPKSDVSLRGADLKESVPSQFLLPKFPYIKPGPVPKKLTVTLTETPTIFHFERQSATEPAGSEAGHEVKAINERYHRRLDEAANSVTKKSADMETQTPVIFRRDQKTMAKRCVRSNTGANVTTYDIYKTNKLLQKIKKSIGDAKIVQDPMKMKVKKSVKEESVFTDSIISEKGAVDSTLLSESLCSDEKSIMGDPAVSTTTNIDPEKLEELAIDVFQSKKFKNAAFFIERMLASNVFEREQKIFKGIIHEDLFPLEIDFTYTLEKLWTYTNDHVKGRSITSVSWNKVNSNLLAAGYGKYYYRDKRGGVVCVWCIKNPVQPERMYKFSAPVQSVDFSTQSPNLLAVGFYNGDIAILDVSNQGLSIVAQNDRETMTTFAPLWRVLWVRGEEHGKGDQVMTAGQDGRIFKYMRGKTFLCFQMMRMTRSEGKTRGINIPRKCDKFDIPISCHPPALALALHPKDAIFYFVGTAEGGVHKCSVNYLSHHLEMFIAHRGPVYNLQFSPFSNTIFLTCGADFCIRIWQDGIGDPLFSLSVTGSRDPVLDATWSPNNAHIIASVSGSQIHIWDISRKISAPVSTTNSPSPVTPVPRLSTIRFEKSGKNLVVGDIRGRLYLFALKNMPFPPFYQEEALVRSVIKALATRPDLYKELRKVYPLFEELAETKK